MKVRLAIGQLVALLAGGPTAAQDIFSLGIEGSEAVEADDGDVVREDYVVSLGHTGGGPGAQSWSFGVRAYATKDGARIVSATTAGTAADLLENGGFRQGGFEKTEMVDRALNAGRSGIVSSVVLSLDGSALLPANATFPVASLQVEFTIPVVAGVAELFFDSGLRGSGPPVDVQVIQDGVRTSPIHGIERVALREGPGCCLSSLNVGFSTRVLRGVPPFEGVEGLGSKCEAGLGTVEHIATAPQAVYVNMITQLEPGLYGVAGWALSIRLEGEGEMLSATTAGTAADRWDRGGLFQGGFNKTQVVDPAVNGGRKGAISAIVLSLDGNEWLPHESTESVLALQLDGPEGSTSVLSVFDGLRGASQPVRNYATYAGETISLCNLETARLTIRHLVVDDFIRGNANGDQSLDIGDPVWILNALFHDGRPSPCADAADSNDDGRIDLSDAVHLIRYLFLMGEPPRQPFPDCGLDLTEDDLGCPGDSPAC